MHITFHPNEGSVAVATEQLELITPGDARYGALAKVAARHNLTPEEWQERARFIEFEDGAHRAVDQLMRQVPRYREEAA